MSSRILLTDWRMMRRDLHLGDADPVGDLGLRQVLLEAQAQDLAVAVAEHLHRVVEQHAHLGALELDVAAAQRVGERDVLARGLVERARAAGAGGLDRRQHLLEGRLDRVGQLLHGG